MNSNKEKGLASKIWEKVSTYSALCVVLILLCVIIQLNNPLFLTFDNIISVFRQLAVYGIVGIGMGFLMLNGYIDLSIGSLIGLCGVVEGLLMTRAGLSMWMAIPLTVLFGALIGAFNGFFITLTDIPPFIFTLAMTNVYRGIVFIITGGQNINGLSDDFLTIGRNSFLGVPISVYIFFVVLIIAWIVLTKTTFGRSVYVAGGNRLAARYSGLKVRKITILCYAISGVAVSIASTILASKLASVQPSLGQGYEMEAISVAAIGGISLTGGSGSVVGILIGALILGVIDNGMIMIGVTSYWQMIIKGIIIVLAVCFDMFRKHKKQ